VGGDFIGDGPCSRVAAQPLLQIQMPDTGNQNLETKKAAGAKLMPPLVL